MKISAEQFAAHLHKAKTLAPIYLIYGEEPLQAQEAADALRSAARTQHGYYDRQCLTVETGFDWESVRQEMAATSLFADRRLIELRLGNAKPGDAGAKVFIAYTEQPAEDTVLLITAGKLDAATQKTRWFTALETAGVVVPSQPLALSRFPAWIAQRAKSRDITLTDDAVVLLSTRTEGNLLAAAQEIDKLALVFEPKQRLGADEVFAAVCNSARYNLYECVDAALQGQTARAVQMLYGLRSEGVEPILINWAFHQEARILVALAIAQQRRQPLDAVFTAYAVWEKRRPALQKTLQRLALRGCREVLRACATADRMIKGAESGAPWDVLIENALRLGKQHA